MVYDCIPFFNELDILNLRLHVLSDCVDRFIIEESTRTFSGEPKELCFEKNKKMFAPFLSRIDYVVVSDDVLCEDGLHVNPAAEKYAPEIPDQPLTHRRDYFQKNHLMDHLKNLKENDIILFGDLDEIPNPDTLKKVIASYDPSKVYHLAQRNFYVFLNMGKSRCVSTPSPGNSPIFRRISANGSEPKSAAFAAFRRKASSAFVISFPSPIPVPSAWTTAAGISDTWAATAKPMC